MGIFEKEEKRKRREAEEAQKKLQEEAQNCLNEITPILKKYNFELGAKIEVARNGLMARPEFVRPQSQPPTAPNKLSDLPMPKKAS